MSQTFTKLSVGCLVTIAILFFLPWYTTNFESEIFANESVITGFSFAKYADSISSSSFVSLIQDPMKKGLLSLILGVLRFLYLLPILALVAAGLQIFRIRGRRGLAATVYLLHLILGLILLLIPNVDPDLSSLMRQLFVTTPSIYLILVTSIVGLFASFAPVPPAAPAKGRNSDKTPASNDKGKARR